MVRRAVVLILSGVVLAVIPCATAHAQFLAAAVLPSSRSVQLGSTATAFATIVNGGSVTATGCGISLGTAIPAFFFYQTTDPSTNTPIGSPNTKVSIQAGQFRTFVFAITPTATFSPTDVRLVFACDNAGPAGTISGVNTLLLSSSLGPVPDVVALAATLTGDGIMTLNPLGIFAVAAVNVGAAGLITATVDTGSASLPVILQLCRSNPANGQCLTPIGPSVPVPIGSGETPTFSVFGTATGSFAFDPGVNRAFVRFKDAGGVTRGSTSVALKSLVAASGLSGTWHLSGSGTAVSDSGDSSPLTLSFPPFAVAQSGNALSGTAIVGTVNDVVDFPLPPGCAILCGAPGSCSLTCPGLTCSITCTPATAGCGERNDLTGTVSGSTLSFTVRSDTLVQATCSGMATGTLFARDTTTANAVGTVVGGSSPTATGTFSGRTVDTCGGTGDFSGLLECESFNFSGTFNLSVTSAAASRPRQDHRDGGRVGATVLQALSRTVRE